MPISKRKEGRKLDLFSQFAMVATEEAFLDSGLVLENTKFS